MKKILLLIEDDEPLRDLYRQRLALEDFKIIDVHDGVSGVKRTKKEKPDLVLLDIRLPKMNGFEVLRVLKEDEATKNIPVVILTALPKDNIDKRCYELGAEAFFSKPDSKPSEVIDKIKKLIS